MRIEIPIDIWPKLLKFKDYSDFEENIDNLAKDVEKSLVRDYGNALPYTIAITKYDFILGVIRTYFRNTKSLEPEKEKIIFDYAYYYLENNWEQFLPSNIVHAFTIDEENYVFSFQLILDKLSYPKFCRLVLVTSTLFSVESKEMCQRFINESKSFKSLSNELLKEYALWFIAELELRS